MLLLSKRIYLSLLILLTIGWASLLAGWTPGQVPLMSPWGERLNPDSVLQEYPRPQMQRKAWKNLNGLWEFELAQAGDPVPFNRTLNDTILVPFPIESALSGIMKATDYAYYKHSFTLPSKWQGRRILLHFGAVDWHSKIFVNGHLVKDHKGGYDSFAADITDVVSFNVANELIVWVYDPTDKGGQPVGKQSESPQSIWFSAVTGIWQTVWLEAVPQIYIQSIRLTPDIDAQCLNVEIFLNDSLSSAQVIVQAYEDSLLISSAYRYGSGPLRLTISDPKLWQPNNPFLYDLKIITKSTNVPNDTLTSYFAMRKIGLKQDAKGRARLALNNKIYFQFGPLDQGYWPGGLYTAPSDEALKYDIQGAKRLGFNLIRKHVKVDPDRWYYWCDKLGMLVWQDMPNGRNHSADDKTEFENELKAMVQNLYNHPCIVQWDIFNENWGRFDTKRLVNLVRSLDATRLINANSGWNVNGYDEGVGDVNDIHHYEEPEAPLPESKRAIVCGEYGGLWRQVEGHTWTTFDGSGYQSGNAMANRYIALTHNVQDLIEQNGLSAAIYTEITDVEREYAGLVTYDRKEEKCFYLPIYYANSSAIETKIEDQRTTVPNTLQLLQNFPNPFNGQTTIAFFLPRRIKATLKIYDIAGREVATLINEKLTAGWHKVFLSADKWASGVYFCRLISGNKETVHKIVLLR